MHVSFRRVATSLRRKFAKGLGGLKVTLQQPWMRLWYVKYMGGVDTSDQMCTAHCNDHRPLKYYWRRVFKQIFFQAIVNAYLLFTLWVNAMISRVDGLLATELVDDERKQLVEVQARLEVLAKIERGSWDTALAEHLMSRCQIGHATGGGSRTRRPASVPEQPGNWVPDCFEGVSSCFAGACKKRTKGGCRCSRCQFQAEGGLSTKTRICKECCADVTKHDAAVQSLKKTTARGKPWKWKQVVLP